MRQMIVRTALVTAAALALLMALVVGCASPGTQSPETAGQPAKASSDRKAAPKPRKPAGSIPAEGVASPAHETLFQQPTKIHSWADHVDVAGDIGSEEWNDSHRIWLFAAPPGELTTTYNSVTMKDRATGETRVFSTPEELKLLESNYHFERTFTIRDLGVLRRLRLVAISVKPGVNVMVEATNYGLQSFDVTIGFPKWTPEGVDDNAFSDPGSPIRGMVTASVANPEMIELYAQNTPPYPALDDPESAAWQPRPDLSPGGPWLKIPIKKDDLYSIDGRWLAENGLDPAKVAPDSLVLVSNGEEVAMVQAGPADASFSQGARLLFFGLESRSKETNERIYFLGQRSKSGKRGFEEASRLSGTPTPLSTFVRSARIEEDNTLQTRLGNFLSVREMTWLWGKLVKDEPTSFEFRAPGLPGEIPEALATVHMYYAGQGVSGPVLLDAVLNGREMRMGATLTADRTTVDFTIPAGVLQHDLNTLELTLKAPQETPNRELPPIFFDAIELDYNSLFKAEDGREIIEITEAHPVEGEHELQVVGFRPYRLLGLDITDPNRPLRLSVRDGEGYSYVDAALHPGTRLLLTEDDAVVRAPMARKSVWQDWRESRTSADVVVVHHSSFARQAERLAEDIRGKGLSVLAVDVESIYEAYTGGELSTAAIRRFAADAINNWEHKPSYLIAFGDCTSDGRGISRNDVVNYVPTRAYKATEGDSPDLHATEPYFGWLNGDDELTDIIIGRISVSNEADADEVVQKVIDYRQLKPSYWTNRLVNLSDGGEFYKASQKLFKTSMADWFNEWTISTVDYPWEDNFYLPKQLLQGDEVKVSPTITNMLLKEFDEGMGFVTFFGHGSPNIWSNQRLWFGGNTENSDNLRLNNRDRLPFMASFTCNNGAIDYPVPRWNVCISEDMMRVPNGGVIGCFVPSGPGYSERHLHLAEGFFKSITFMNIRNFGMVADLSRLYYQATLGADDHSRMFLLLGDPTLDFPIARADAAIEVTPERFDESVSQKVTLRVTATDRLTTGVAYLKGKDGVVLQQKLLLADGDGIITGELDPELPVHFRDFKVVVQAWSDSGGLFQVGKRVSRAPAEVVITNVEIGELNAQDPVRMSRRVRYSISNKSYFRQEAQLVVNRFADKARIPIVVEPLVLEGFQDTIVDVVVIAPVGAHVLEARVLPSSPTYYRIDLPSNATYDCMIIPHQDDVADLAIPSLAFRLLPSRAKASSPMVETFVANLGPQRTEGDLRWGIKYRDEPEITGVRPLGPMLGHSVQRLRIPMRMQMDMKTLLTVSLSGESRGVDDAFPDNNAIEKSLVPAMTADLRIVPESITVEPGHLTEGVTVFVTGEVENIGAQRSYATEVSLFSAEDNIRSTPLRSIGGQPQPDIPPLNPRERWPFRVRWDPTNNLGVWEIVAMVDPREMLIEPNKSNNLHRVPLDVRSSWKLVAEGMKLERSPEPGAVILVAVVRNDGDTDAQRVIVNFYKDEKQSKENLLGDVLVERIPAKATALVRLQWQPSAQEMNESRRPSFDMAIKGSQQRFSSVATPQ